MDGTPGSVADLSRSVNDRTLKMRAVAGDDRNESRGVLGRYDLPYPRWTCTPKLLSMSTTRGADFNANLLCG
jgi:hypothetical protein